MALERRLKRWVEADLIQPEQARRILEFEQGRDRPMLLYAVAGLGGLAIAIGFVSIVAANWDVIPGQWKIGIDLMLLLTGGIAFAHGSERWPNWLRETSLLVLYGLTLGSIALVGQVYQLGGSIRDALSVWSLLTFPLMTRGNTGFVALVWLVGLQSTIAAWMTWLSERPNRAEGWALMGTSIVPWVLLLLGDAAWLRRLRANYASAFYAAAWAELVLCASIGVNMFYENTRPEPWNALWLGLALAAAALSWFWFRHRTSHNVRAEIGLLLACLVLTYVPARLSPGDWDILAALLFIGLWLLVSSAAHGARLYWVMNLATAAVALRILIVYFEVFGSLLSTGLGLVLGGALTLLLAWLWWRTRRGLLQRESS